jgi:hypothetical protein
VQKPASALVAGLTLASVRLEVIRLAALPKNTIGRLWADPKGRGMNFWRPSCRFRAEVVRRVCNIRIHVERVIEDTVCAATSGAGGDVRYNARELELDVVGVFPA